MDDLLERLRDNEPQLQYAFFAFKEEDEFPEIIDFVAQMETELGITVERYSENTLKEDLQILVDDEKLEFVILGN